MAVIFRDNADKLDHDNFGYVLDDICGPTHLKCVGVSNGKHGQKSWSRRTETFTHFYRPQHFLAELRHEKSRQKSTKCIILEVLDLSLIIL